eukprot:Pgem_evm1s6450
MQYFNINKVAIITASVLSVIGVCEAQPNRRSMNNPFTGSYYTAQNAYDRSQRATAHSEYEFISGFKSEHNNRKEDRRWSIRISQFDIPIWKTNNCRPQKLNNYDEDIDWFLPPNTVLTSFSSEHNNRKEDREFTVTYCVLQDNLVLTKKGAYQLPTTNWDKDFDMKCTNDNDTIIHIKSEHWNRKEDRVWTITCAPLDHSPGVSSGGDYLNRNIIRNPY